MRDCKVNVMKLENCPALGKAPQELRPFSFLMAWHPRLDSDLPHVWLREAMHQVSPQEASGQCSEQDVREARMRALQQIAEYTKHEVTESKLSEEMQHG